MKTSRNVILIALIVLCQTLWPAARESQSGGPDERVERDKKLKIIDSVTKALNEEYVFPDVAKKMEEFVREKFSKGKYDRVVLLNEFTQLLTRDLQSVSRDLHLRINPIPPARPGDTGRPSKLKQYKYRQERERAQNYGFRKIEIFPGNIGYLDLRMFAAAYVGSNIAVAAMNFLANTDVIIFDLRLNGGGDPSMIQLISSYFFDEPVHLNSFYIRKGNRKQEFWTHKEVQGPRMTDKVIYILTSGYTFSGAEEFTYNMKNLKRATIIGETTGGGAHPVNLRVFAELQLQVSIPFGRAINPVSGTNWEGTGVSPHIQVPADKALSRARQEALKLLIDKNDDPIAKNRLHWLLERLELKEKPIIMDSRVLDDYVGHYGARTVKMKDGNLHLQWEERVGFRLIPTGNDIFMVDKVEYLRIRFDRDRNSKVTTMVRLNDDGTSEIYSRSDL